MSEKIKCDVCKENMAVWLYMPSSTREDNFFCEECVPRGCSCGREYLDMEDYDNTPPEDKTLWKWIEVDKIWAGVDEKGREWPCCEYSYDDNGFDEIGYDDIIDKGNNE